MTLRQLLDLYDNWNGYTQVNDKNCNPHARVKTDRLTNGNYDYILDCEVMSFGFYDDEFCIRIDYEMNAELKNREAVSEAIKELQQMW